MAHPKRRQGKTRTAREELMTRLLLPQWLFARTAAHGTFITLYAANAAITEVS